jgi:hypothetical protein
MRVESLASLCLLVPTVAQGVRVSAIEPRPTGDVVEVRTSADGSRVVYRADHETPGVFHLYQVPADGSAAPQRLAELAAEPEFLVTPDGARVLFSNRSPGTSGLYSVPTDGSVVPLRLDSSGTELVLVPDASRVLYETGLGLRACPLDVAQPVTLSVLPDVPARLTPDGSAVVFGREVWDYPVHLWYSFYRVSLGDPAPAHALPGYAASPDCGIGARRIAFLDYWRPGEIRVSDFDGAGDRLVAHGTAFALTADGARLVFLDLAGDLRSVRTTGPGRARASSGPEIREGVASDVEISIAPATGAVADFELTPGDDAVVFTADDGSGFLRLFVAPVEGGVAPLLLAAPAGNVDGFVLTSDGVAAVFTADGALHSVPLDLSRPAIQLAAPAHAGGEVEAIFTNVAGARVVFAADHLQDGVIELFGVPLDGGAPAVRLNAPIPPGESLASATVMLDPSGTRVLYVGAQDQTDVHELFAAPADGASAPLQLSAEPPLGIHPRAVLDYALPAAAPGAIYRGNSDDETRVELFSALAGEVVRLSAPSGARHVVTYRISADGARAVYGTGFSPVANESPHALFGVPADGSAAPVRLETPLFGGVIDSYVLDPLGQHVVFAYRNVDEKLYSVPALGGPLVELTAGTEPVTDTYRVTPDGTRLVYAGHVAAQTFLFAVPLDGSAPPQPLAWFQNQPDWLLRFTLSPDSTRAVVEVDLGTRPLYAVDLDGQPGLVPTRIDGGLVPEDARILAISADSSRAAFLADVGDTGRVDLYGVPLDGSAAPVLLSGVVPATRDVTAFAIAADSSRVVYSADSLADQRFELFVVPLDGGAPPLRLNADLPNGADVASFALTPDGSRAVYLAEQLVNDRQELFAVPLDGGAAPVLLSGSAQSFADVSAYTITADSRRVHFLRNSSSDGQVELFVAPLDGGAEPRRESSPLVPGGNVLSFRVDATGARVFYLADQEFDGSPELFLHVPGPGREARTAAPTRTVTR